MTVDAWALSNSTVGLYPLGFGDVGFEYLDFAVDGSGHLVGSRGA
jgi:hypothetical protein